MAAIYQWKNTFSSFSVSFPQRTLTQVVPKGWSVQRVITYGGYYGAQTFNFGTTAPKVQAMVEASLIVRITREGGPPAAETLMGRSQIAEPGFTRVNDTLPIPLSNINDGVCWWFVPASFWEWDSNVRQDSPNGLTHVDAEFYCKPKTPPNGANYVWPTFVGGTIMMRCLLSKPA